MVDSISVLGSTGSVGRQTLAVAKRLGLHIRAMTAGHSIKLLEAQAREFMPQLAVMSDEAAAKELRISLADTPVCVLGGSEALCEAAVMDGAQAVVTAVSGSVGLKPTLAAISAKRRICLANKETLVCAGKIVMSLARETGAEIIPVDSEHSAIFQCLAGREKSELRRILLTGSGGPFRGRTLDDMRGVTPEVAVKHPNWSMGAKISVDSATLMNKGLEYIEAMHLFGVTPEDITILIHPESVIHSMVELRDSAVIAQLGIPDMSLPIQYALTWPQRSDSDIGRLDFSALSRLTFSDPDYVNFPCLALAVDCAKKGGNAAAVLSAANETAVADFLAGRIGFTDIYRRVSAALESVPFISEPTLDELLLSDAEARSL